MAAVLQLTQGIKLMKALSMGSRPQEMSYVVIMLLVITRVCSIHMSNDVSMGIGGCVHENGERT